MVIKIGLIGLGSMGSNHLRTLSILKQVEIAFVYDIDTVAMKQAAKQYDVPISTNLGVDLKKIDAAIITTPTVTHDDYVRLIGEYVPYLFVEKPLTADYHSTQQLMKFVHDRRSPLHIQVGFIERFNPAVVELKKLLSTDKSVLNIDFTRTNKLSSRIKDVDVVTDLMIHDIDLALHLNGNAKLLQAYGVVEDSMIVFARAVLQHDNGVFSNILASRVTEKRLRQIRITGRNFYVDCNLLQKELVMHKQAIQNYGNVTLHSIEETIAIPPGEALLLELLAFLKCVENQDFSQAPSLNDALQSIKLVEEISTAILGQV